MDNLKTNVRDAVKIANAATNYLKCVYSIESRVNDRHTSQHLVAMERKSFDDLLEAVTGTRALLTAGPALGLPPPPDTSVDRLYRGGKGAVKTGLKIKRAK